MAVVELVWGSIWIPALAKNEDVWVAAEWIWEDGDWAEVDVGVVAWGLTGGRPVEIPLWEVFKLDLAIFWDLGDGLFWE
jgi:hypothetical protein